MEDSVRKKERERGRAIGERDRKKTNLSVRERVEKWTEREREGQ